MAAEMPDYKLQGGQVTADRVIYLRNHINPDGTRALRIFVFFLPRTTTGDTKVRTW